MKIQPGSDSVRFDTSQPKTSRSGGPAKASAESDVTISRVASQLSKLETEDTATFDQKKVDELKSAIREGRFQVNSEVVADKLIASTKELLARPGQ